MKLLLWPALLALSLPGTGLGASGPATALENDAKTILSLGPRVAGSSANERARQYFETQFRALGYQTRRESFSYPRFDDLGSDVRSGNQVLAGNALQNSIGGAVTALAVRVPGLGDAADYAGLNVRGKVAVLSRGGLTFAQKARAALEAGAAGLIIVNNAAGNLRGTLGEEVSLPVLGVSSTAGAAITDGQPLTLSVRVRRGEVQGINLIAFKSGVTAPALLFGGHLDSVQGAPGANDNLSGSLAVLELARRSVNTPLSARSYFTLFDAEEDGLLGSRAFVKANASSAAGLKAMFNLDMVGVAAEPLTLGGDANLTGIARRVTTATINERAPGGSDHVPFREAGVPTLFFHRGLDANYHQPGDTLLDLNLVRDTVDTVLKIAGEVPSSAATK
jgi:aminopeptidase YwaD